MKNHFLILLAISFTIILTTSTESTASNPAVANDILIVPKAAYAPTIDGQLDSIWKNVANNKLLICYYPPQNWLDMFSGFRMMWDDRYFYIFVTVHDEIIYTTHENWVENDCFSFVFDGDNSKNSQQQGFDDNDIGWYFNFGKDPHCSNETMDVSSVNYVFLRTSVGWNLEIAFKFLGEMTFDAIPLHEFGLEIYFNDNDHGVREHFSRWYSWDPTSWQTPGSWGTAKLSDRLVSDTLAVNYTVTKPQIDGKSDDTWAGVPLISHNTYVTDDSLWDIKSLNDWKDLQFDYQVMWDDNYFYALIQVIDDKKYNQQTNPWDNDGVELYFDGDHSKTEGSFDENDDRLIFVYNGKLTSVHSHINTSNIEYAFATRSDGWSLESAIPFSNLKFNPAVDRQFGFEVQVNDTDGKAVRENMARWWSNTIDLEQNPGLFGTAQLVKVAGTDVETPKNSNVIDNYYLAQNYPNPFNAETTIRYQLPAPCHVTLRIINILGQEIVRLVDKQQQSGHYVVSWNVSQVSSGVYFYELTAQDGHSVKFSKINKMLLMK